MPQVGSRPRLIINFTWSGLNDIADRLALMEAMHFGGALLRILKQVFTADLFLGPVYLGKVDLVGSRDTRRSSDLRRSRSKKTPSNTHMVGFHLSLPMGYIDSAPYF